MAERGRIVVATSIPPKLSRTDGGRSCGEEYQRLCVRSWIACGFRVLSVNEPGEIEALAAKHPEIEFVPAPRISERKTPYIADLMGALTGTGEASLGIVNADILFEPASAWQNEIPSLSKKVVVAVQRHDTNALEGGALRRYRAGYDCFFFGRDVAIHAAKNAGTFAMGLPWWDYWFPAFAMFKGREIRLLERPVTLHLHHPQTYQNASMYRYARLFAKSAIETWDLHSMRPGTAELLRACRDFAALQEHPGEDSEAAAIANGFVRKILPWRKALSANAVKFAAETNEAKGAFQRIEERIAAGAAFESAHQFGDKGKSQDEGTMYRKARDLAPDDMDIVLALAEYQCRQRDYGSAVKLLAQAEAKEPPSARFLNTMGTALHKSGKREEANSYFERALEADPEFRGAAVNRAITLFALGRIGDALAVTEAARAKWPNDAELQKLRALLANKAEIPGSPGRQ